MSFKLCGQRQANVALDITYNNFGLISEALRMSVYDHPTVM